jgi:uncharacterized protein YggL (DUF469 family)
MYRGPRKIKSKKRRLQKKHYLGEWAEIGFSVEGEFVEWKHDHTDKFIDLVESFGYICGGGSNRETFEYIIQTPKKYGKISESEVNKFLEELKNKLYYLTIKKVKYNIDINHERE